ncbi:MAG: winged helix-turn-helix domain-containing protein [Pseudomonadota bacterium]
MIYRFEDFRFDSDARELRCAGTPRAVERQVLELLDLLISNADRMVTKEEIIERVWDGRAISDGSINGRIKLLRKALDDDGKQQRLIKTHHGEGFRFVGSVKTSGAAKGAQPRASTSPALPDRPSIAVLPFDNMSSDPEQEFVADGMCEDILTALSKFPELFVIARNSTFKYKGIASDVRDVGSELGVAFVLEGSVRRHGDRLRITAQLIDAQTGAHVWADRYDRETEDIFSLQDEMTQEIVSAMLGELVTTTVQAKIWAGGTNNFDAWQAVVKATLLVATMDRTKMTEAVRLLETAIALDPDYGSARVVLANAHYHFAINGWSADPQATIAEIARRASEALEINPEDSLATALLSFTALVSGDMQRAGELATRAIALGPDVIASVLMVAMICVYLGRFEEAAKYTEHCIRLSPIARTTISTTAAFVYTASGQYDTAITYAEDLLAEDPANVNGQIAAIIAQHQTGNNETAKQLAAGLMRCDPVFSVERYLSSLFLTDHPVGQRSRNAMLAAGLAA